MNTPAVRATAGDARTSGEPPVFDGDFLRKLERLELLARKVLRGLIKGEHSTVRRGHGIEFSDFRRYQPGDDFRYIDWNIFSRLDRLVLKLYTADEDVTLYVLLDASASMGFGTPPKFDHARRLAASLAYIGLNNLDRVVLRLFAGELGAGLPPLRTRRRIRTVLDFLGRQQPSGETAFGASLRDFAARAASPGLVTVVTDLLGIEDVENGLDALRHRGHDVVVLQVLSEEDIEPSLDGALSLVDAENGAAIKVTVDAELRELYGRRLRERLQRFERYCLGAGIEYLRTSTAIPFEEVMLRYLRQGVHLRVIEVAQPWALLALLSVPAILVLYSLRPSRRNVVVSSNALWQEALRERRRGLGLQKLLNNLSLLLLLLFALLASLALGDPQWLTRTADRGDVVLILDTSASMQTRTGGSSRFELARRQAAGLIDDLPATGRMLIMTSGRNPVLRTAFDDDKRVLHERLEALAVTDEAGRPRAALTLALSLLRHRERGRVIFLTDAAFDEHVGFGAAEIEYRLVGGPARNVAITRFDVRAEIGSESRFEVLATVTNHADQPLQVPLAVSLDDNILVERTLALPAGATRTEVWPFKGRASGRARARIDVDDDLAVDNQAFAVMGTERTLRVLLLSPGSFYLEHALRALPNVVVRQLAQVPGEYLEQEVARYDVVVIDRLAAPELPPGAYLLVDSVPPGLPFASAGRVSKPLVTGRGASALLQQVDLTGLRVEEARIVEVAERALPPQRLFWSEQTPLALAGIDRQRRFVYLGFDPARSSFPLQAAFPLFIRQSVEWLRPGDGGAAPTQIEAGEPYTIGVPAGRHDVIVRGPDGEAAVHTAEGGELLYEQTSRVGIYQYALNEEGGLAPRFFAVNLADARESDINPRPLPVVDAQAQAVPQTQGQATLALWPWLAAAALLVLALEWCVLLRRRRHA